MAMRKSHAFLRECRERRTLLGAKGNRTRESRYLLARIDEHTHAQLPPGTDEQKRRGKESAQIENKIVEFTMYSLQLQNKNMELGPQIQQNISICS